MTCPLCLPHPDVVMAIPMMFKKEERHIANRLEENSASNVITYFSSIKMSKMKSTNTPCKKALGRQYAVARMHAGRVNT